MPTDRSRGAHRDSNSGRLSVRLSPRLLARVASAVEDGPYHSRSQLVRAALHLLLAPADPVRADGSGESSGAERARPDDREDVCVGAIREVFPAADGDDAPRAEVTVVDRRRGARPATHTFVYDADRASRTVRFRTYEPPAGLTREGATSIGALRERAEAALAARNWRVDDPG